MFRKICAAAITALCLLAAPAVAQICSDGEILLISSHYPERSSFLRELAVNIGGNGENAMRYYDQLVASDAFSAGGALFGFKPVSNFAPLREFSAMMMDQGKWVYEHKEGVQILSCPTAKKFTPVSWQQYCDGKDQFKLTAFVLSNKKLRPFDLNKLPIDPQQCSKPSTPAAQLGWVPHNVEGGASPRAITYRSPTMLPGEAAVMWYTGTKSGKDNYGGSEWPDSSNVLAISIALTSGQEPITGFDGVTLRSARDNKDLLTLYSTTTANYRAWQYSGEDRCGVGTLGMVSDTAPAKCSYKCFRSADDLYANRNMVACSTGDARWIRVDLAGSLRQKRKLDPADRDAARVRKELEREAAALARKGELSLTEAVDRAGSLAVHVKWKGSTAVTFPIDEMFRTSFWDPDR